MNAILRKYSPGLLTLMIYLLVVAFALLCSLGIL